MTPVVWTRAALHDLQQILDYIGSRSQKGAASIARRVQTAVATMAQYPRAARRDSETGAYECVVRGAPLLIIYDITPSETAERIEVIAIFHTSRDPAEKPGH